MAKVNRLGAAAGLQIAASLIRQMDSNGYVHSLEDVGNLLEERIAYCHKQLATEINDYTLAIMSGYVVAQQLLIELTKAAEVLNETSQAHIQTHSSGRSASDGGQSYSLERLPGRLRMDPEGAAWQRHDLRNTQDT